MLKKFKGVPSSSLSSQDICNRNSLLIKQAHKFMEVGDNLGIIYHGGEREIIKNYIEMEVEDDEISDKELEAIVDGYDDLEGSASISLEF
ncbi:hypothetical protein RHMOL_Rhmol12G0102100 [Rhododendron molle]|uniref:Uncharacterized protein n=1 Tax=Rhododendron molle TaxID=49168 RepID=A0ACC0LHP4_RHOML|nr:hypothetical protein RHMOL_Rhmol12G0102100 [Rhododendron molle]